MTWNEACAEYFGISIEEAEMIDPCDLTEEDEIAISSLMYQG